MNRRLCLLLALLPACAATQAERKPLAAIAIPSAGPNQRDPAALAAPAAPSAAEVTYRGELMSGGELIAVETTLIATESNLTGRYLMIDGERHMPGELSECFATGQGQGGYTCMWQDEFGVGGLELEFSPDRQRFTGLWWPEAEPESKYPWNGSRIPAVAE